MAKSARWTPGALIVLALLHPACGSSDSDRAGRTTPDGGDTDGGSGSGGKVGSGGAGSSAGGKASAGGRSGSGGAISGAGGAVSGGAGGAAAGGAAAGGADAGSEPDASDASDAGSLPACPASDAGVLAGFTVETFSAGDHLAQPAAMVFGDDGTLYVANSRSFLSGIADPGDILAIDGAGTQTVFLANDLLRGPDGLAFGKPGDAGGQGPLLVAIEDGDEAQLAAADYFVTIASGAPAMWFDVLEPGNLLRGPGGAFGSDLYYTARTTLSLGAPNELRLFRVTDAGTKSVVTVTSANDGGAEITGAAVFDFVPGGASMYLGTVVDPNFSPDAVAAVYQVDAAGKATVLVDSYTANALAVSRSRTGPFGDFVYAAKDGAIDRIDPQGNVTRVVPGLDRPFALLFGPDDLLYFAEPLAGTIRRIRPCAE